MKGLLTDKKPEKRLLKFIQKSAGRNNSGKITVRHQGGGVKRLYRVLDFGQGKMNEAAKVLALEYDPNRTAYIALLQYPDQEKRYVVAAHGLKVGDQVVTAETAEIKTGNRLKLKNIPVGTSVFNVELIPGQGGKMVRSAGSSAQVLAQEGSRVNLQMPSKEIRTVSGECFATVGAVSNPEHIFKIVGKAGSTRRKGVRPTVRGSAMNPLDHPHGGGEGRTSVGLKYPKTPWGKHAKGVKTRKRKWTDRFILKRRVKK